MLELFDDIHMVKSGMKQNAPSKRITAFSSDPALNCIEVKNSMYFSSLPRGDKSFLSTDSVLMW